MKHSWLKRKTGLAKRGKSDFSKAVAKLDTAVSLLVRARDRELPCVTCGTMNGDMDCGHFRIRQNMATRFNLKNLARQCKKCNRFAGGRPYEFGLELDRRHGKGTSKEMYEISKTIKQWQVKELEQLTSAARKGVMVYNQLYRELAKLK